MCFKYFENNKSLLTTFNFSGENFREVVEEYIRKALSKGVPPLFVDLRPLYSFPVI